jgi:hypothetical protein
MDFGDIGEFVDSGGELLGDVSHLLSGILKVKSQWQRLRGGRAQPGGTLPSWTGN